MNQKHGSPVSELPLSTANRGLSAEERFWKSVDKTGDCWLWTAGKDKDGYGVFDAFVGDINLRRAHRYSYIRATGEVLGKHQVVMHSCDTPSCVNPAHLSSGLYADNTADMIAKGRHAGGKIRQAQKVSRLTEDEVRAILRDPRPYPQIAKQYAVHRNHVMLLKGRKTRSYVEIGDGEIVKSPVGVKGEDRSPTLKESDVLHIRACSDHSSALARQYNVSPQTICDIRKGRSWKHLLPKDEG